MSDVRELFGAMTSMVANSSSSSSSADVEPQWGTPEEDVPGVPDAEEWWTRENDPSQRGKEGLQRAVPRTKSERPASSPRWAFGTTGDLDLPGSDHVHKEASLENRVNVPGFPEVAKSVTVCEMPSKDGDPNKAWKMSIPASFFGEAEEWGRLRDARVRFEPDQIIVEAHDRHGNSKIIHCSDIPRRLVAESSTYKLDPDGKEVQLTLHTEKSPPRSKAIFAQEKAVDIIENEKDSCAKGDGDQAHFAIRPERRKGKLFCDAPTTPSHFL